MFFDRTGGAKSTAQRQVTRTKEYPGPHLGWVKGTNARHSPLGSAIYLANFFPTKQGGRARKGSATVATLPGEVFHMSAYEGATAAMFAWSDTSLYNVTSPVDPFAVPPADLSGFTSSDWASVQFTAGGGGHYLVASNGVDGIKRYNGTAWLNEAASPAITNAAGISQLWSFKRFLWGVRKGTLKAAYLPVGAIGGAFTDFPLESVFTKGGELLFGATWSLNAGSGLGDVCLFVTSKGEIAVYEGLTPADMTLSGLYQIGTPIDKNSWFRSGGDLVIMTRDGAVPVSAAIDNDRAALKGKRALTLPIEPEWQRIIRLRIGSGERFPVALWQSRGMLVVGLPRKSGEDIDCLIANAVDGTWAKFIGWDIRALCVFGDDLYFGTGDGAIKKAETGGSDDGDAYTCVYVPSFDNLGNPNEKAACHARIIARTNFPFSVQMFACADYALEVPPPLPAGLTSAGSFWDVNLWDAGDSIWTGSDEANEAELHWQSCAAVGHSLTPGVAITIGQDEEPEFELIGIDLQYENGSVITG